MPIKQRAAQTSCSRRSSFDIVSSIPDDFTYNRQANVPDDFDAHNTKQPNALNKEDDDYRANTKTELLFAKGDYCSWDKQDILAL